MKNIWILIDDFLQSHKKPEQVENPYSKTDFYPERITVEIKQPEKNYDVLAEMERLQVLKDMYLDIDTTIENEIDSLEEEKQDPNISLNRVTAINKRYLVLLNKRATNTGKLQAIERKMEECYKKSKEQ